MFPAGGHGTYIKRTLYVVIGLYTLSWPLLPSLKYQFQEDANSMLPLRVSKVPALNRSLIG